MGLQTDKGLLDLIFDTIIDVDITLFHSFKIRSSKLSTIIMMLRHPTSHGNPGPGHVRREHGSEPPLARPLGAGAALAQVPRPRHHRVLRPGHPAQGGAVCKQGYGIHVQKIFYLPMYPFLTGNSWTPSPTTCATRSPTTGVPTNFSRSETKMLLFLLEWM